LPCRHQRQTDEDPGNTDSEFDLQDSLLRGAWHPACAGFDHRCFCTCPPTQVVDDHLDEFAPGRARSRRLKDPNRH
jgi:hypothetical protein